MTELSLLMELSLFFQAVVAGMAAMGMALCLWKLRKLWDHPTWMIVLEDTTYWILVGTYFFSNIYYTNNGKIRWHYILGIVVGSVFSKKIRDFARKMQKKISVFLGRK